MKNTILLIMLLILAGTLIISCGPILPEEPQEVETYCKQAYELLVADYPDFPPSFIGYCVATLQTGKPTGFQGLCSSESFRIALVDIENDVTELLSRKECILYFQDMQ